MKTLDTLFPLIWSNTDMTLLSECQLRWFRRRVQHLNKLGFNIDLAAGKSFAKGMQIARELFYNKKESSSFAMDCAVQTVIDELQKEIAEGTVGDSDGFLKSPERMGEAVRVYFKRFPLEEEELIPAEREDGSFAIEHTLTVELPLYHPELSVPLIFKGKLDMLAKDRTRTYIVDEKTTKQLAYNTGDLLLANGQFIGYAWLAAQKGITITEAEVRKIAVQKEQIKVQPYSIPITPFMMEKWYRAMLTKIASQIESYVDYKEYMENFGNVDEREYFLPDYALGCTSYFKPCTFIHSCTTITSDNALRDIRTDGTGMSEFEQLVWESEDKKMIPLQAYKKLLGLEK